MAHELEVVDGQAQMFSVKAVPWHGLGTILNAPPTIEEGIRCAGLDWEVERQQMFLSDGALIPGAYATVRSTDKKVLGVVGPGYKPVQNRAAFEWFQPFIDQGLATLETAGSLRGGSRVWVMAKINRDPVEIVPGDPILLYALLSNSHDGTLCLRAGFTGTRVVCSNTLSIAHGDAQSKLLRIRHTMKVDEALQQVREVMNLAEGNFLATAEQFRALARKQVSSEDLKEYVRLVFKPRPVSDNETPAGQDADEAVYVAEEKADRLYGWIQPLFERGRGNDMKGVRGTAWAAYNSVTEYITHVRGRDPAVRLDNAWFGEGQRLSMRAYRAAMKMAAA
jgi:phage/plasmid-like protein (TIGR03299 family)